VSAGPLITRPDAPEVEPTSTRVRATLDLSDNTSRYGVPPAARRALATPLDPARYPTPHADTLTAAAAAALGVPEDALVTGTGSDALLDLAFHACAPPGATIAFTEPVFPMVPLFARKRGLAMRAVARHTSGALDLDALLAGPADLVYVCSPDNPTGARVPDAVLAALLARAPGVVVLDEAYVEFAANTPEAARAHARLAARHPRLVVTRTLSKAWGLAGLRVGLAIAAPTPAARMRELRGPYALAAPSERAAAAVLRADAAWVARRVALVRRDRARLGAALVALGLAPLPSHANFVLVPVRDATTLAQRLEAAGVRVRALTALPGIGDAIRITVAPWRELRRLLAALAEVLACA
jgi:histidinol-phosphate aminotransferase